MIDTDLNLLRIFDILYDERNVTRAAARLFLTADPAPQNFVR
jgi:DNA-binding transcriptional LysR family regulator